MDTWDSLEDIDSDYLETVVELEYRSRPPWELEDVEDAGNIVEEGILQETPEGYVPGPELKPVLERPRPLFLENPQLFQKYREIVESREWGEGPLITVSGLNGVGTSTISKAMSEDLGYERVNAGEVFRSLAEDLDISLAELAKDTGTLPDGTDRDVELDGRMLEEGYTGSEIVLEGRMTGALFYGASDVAVYVECDLETAAERRVESGKEDSLGQAYQKLEERREATRNRLEDIYGVQPSEHSFYDIIVDNSGNDVEPVTAAIENGSRWMMEA